MRGHAAVKWLVASGLVWVVAAWPVSAQHHLGHGVGYHFGHIGHGSGIHLHVGAHHHHGVGLGHYAVYRRPLIPSYRQYLVHTPHWRYTPGYGLYHSYYRSYYYRGWYGYGWPGYGCYYPPALYCPPTLYCWPALLPSYCSSVFIWQPLVVAMPYVVGVEKKDGQVVPRRRPAAADDVLANLGPGRQAVDGQDLIGMMNVLKAQELAERARRRRGEAQQNELARFLNIGPAEATEKARGGNRTLAQLEADARRAWKSGRYRDAADRYEELVERNPGRVEYWLRLGFSALDAQDWQRSLAAFRAAARLKGDLAVDDFDLAVWYGDSNLKLRQLDQVAKAALRQPDNPDMWLLVGTFLWFDGQTDRASRFLAKAQDLARADQPLLLVQAMTH